MRIEFKETHGGFIELWIGDEFILIEPGGEWEMISEIKEACGKYLEYLKNDLWR